jgi:beta-lactam-binding protein with PASTA domain
MSHFWKFSTVVVPGVVGQPVENALRILSASHLSLFLLKEKEDPAVAPGTILTQVPSAQEIVKEHQTIYCVISREPSKKIMPSLIGLTRPEIEALCKKNDIAYKLYSQPSENRKGICIAQFPEGGTECSAQQIVTVYYADPCSKEVICPSFIGQALSTVRDFLSSYDIDCKVHYHKPDAAHISLPPDDQWIIVDQRPHPGTICTMSPTLQLNQSILLECIIKK